MKISDIKQELKRQGRYSIYADGKYLFSLSEAGLMQLGLHVGQEIAADELEKLRLSADYDKLYDLTLRYIALRPRSEWEVRTYLKRKEASEAQIVALTERLRENKWLDDVAFAEAWVNNRRQLRQTSKRRLSQELHAKRVSEDVISQVLQADETDERAVLRDLITRKRRLTQYQDDLKLMQYLVRQGFQYDDVKHAVRGEADL